ncbi:MraW methylase family-domain-containing protein [Mucor mucedo]|uniref:MraW methylase family-domain-containing protein n=1 Tax=Mucor mucedo TaxID=29922 RepID=UPI00222013CA|nr:MraW methylase family-domain-containing protein [Mucor mucedo]KAI7880286.1 MraW methylase family-domain-containing protein [Mucor mucedo]
MLSIRHLSRRCLSTTALPYTKIHVPVMLPEVLKHMAPKDNGIYCDMTFGDGGYTKALLDNYNCKVVAVDQDPTAYEKALQLSQLKPYKNRLFPVLGKFGTIQQSIQTEFRDWKVPCFDGIVMDIGVSSGQIETAERGFSYKLDGPLDMRMFSRGRNNTTTEFEKEDELLKKSISAYEIVNFFSREQIADIIYKYGGDRLSRKIADAILAARQSEPIESTGSLAAIIQKACPQPRWQRGNDDMLRNSAARTFQAFRIYINNELQELENVLRSSEHLLKPNGRLVVVTFHSLEDRIAKNFMYHCAGKRSIMDADQNQFSLKRQANRDYRKATKHGHVEGLTLKQAVTKRDQVVPSFELCTKHVVQPSEEEIEENPRSRSAKLRVAKRTHAPALEPFGPSS